MHGVSELQRTSSIVPANSTLIAQGPRDCWCIVFMLLLAPCHLSLRLVWNGASSAALTCSLLVLQEMQALAAELSSLHERHEQHSAASNREADSLMSSR